MKHVAAIVKSLCLAAIAVTTFVGCDGHTTKSLCTDATGPLEGISGVYDLNIRDQETFGIHVSKLRIVPDTKGTVQVKSVGTADDGVKINICNINGAYILEVQDKDLNTFSPARLYVSQAGLHISGLMFDKIALDNANIPNKLIPFPESARKIMGTTLTNKLELGLQAILNESDSKAILVDNTAIPAAKLLLLTKPSSFGFTWFRE